MKKRFVAAIGCLVCFSAFAQENNEPSKDDVVETQEVTTVEEKGIADAACAAE